MNGEKRTKRLKFIGGILIPILIMATAATLLGVSYSWFSPVSEANVASYTLSTPTVFVLSFSLGDVPTNKQYLGQTSYRNDSGSNIHLITNEWATQGLGYGSGQTEYVQYMSDKAHEVGTDIVLDTDSKDVDLRITYDSIKISMPDEVEEGEEQTYTVKKLFSAANGNQNLVPYGFTWYIQNSTTKEYYTPYGVGASNVLSYDTGDSSVVKWNATPTKQNIPSFYAQNETFTFYIVFAPEELYWMQYSNYKANAGDVEDWQRYMSAWYSSSEMSTIFTEMNYSDASYTGATFEFTVLVEVVNVSDHMEA